jgi:hypothetical protein
MLTRSSPAPANGYLTPTPYRTSRNPASARHRPRPAILARISTRSAERRSQRGCLIYSRDEGLETDDPARLGYRAPLIPLARCLGFVIISGLQLPPEGVAVSKNGGHPKASDEQLPTKKAPDRGHIFRRETDPDTAVPPCRQRCRSARRTALDLLRRVALRAAWAASSSLSFSPRP